MSVPSVFRSLYDRDGGIAITGVGVLALFVSAVTLGAVGFGVTLFLLLLVAFAELWRAALRYESRLTEMEGAVAAGRVASDKARRIEASNKTLRAELQELSEKAASPDASYEALLSAINIHLAVLSTVEKHRVLRSKAPDARVTRAEAADDGNVRLTADCSSDPNVFLGESVVVVPSGTNEQASGIAIAEDSNEFEIFATFESGSLPKQILDELGHMGNVVPVGYAIRLAGLVDSFEGISDRDVGALIEALKKARTTIHSAVDGAAARPAQRSAIDSHSEEASPID